MVPHHFKFIYYFKIDPILKSLLRSEEVKFALSDSNPNQSDLNSSMYFSNRKMWMAKDSNLLHMDSNPSPGNSKIALNDSNPSQRIRIQLNGKSFLTARFWRIEVSNGYNPSPTTITDIKGIYTPKISEELDDTHLEKQDQHK